MQTLEQVTRIRHLLNNKSLSFIIGAGFSKNMSDKFVDWGGLLFPLVKEMYGIDDDNDVWHKIEEVGYLGIADISSKIDFTNDELLHIWNKMKLSLSQIKEECDKRSDNKSLFFLSHFDGILDEMKLFVENNSFKAISKEEYDRVHDTIIKLRISVSSNTSHNINELLIEDHTDDAISMLEDIHPEKRFTEFQSEYILLANKIVLKQSKYLNRYMKHFSWIVGTYSGNYFCVSSNHI